jgi:hypothetical protein
MSEELSIQINAVLFKSPEDIRIFPILVTKNNYLKVRGKLEFEKEKIINYLKRLKKDEIIKSIWIPKNKKIQKSLNQLCQVKRDISNSIQKIKIIYKNL